jgi:hypothetical protein
VQAPTGLQSCPLGQQRPSNVPPEDDLQQLPFVGQHFLPQHVCVVLQLLLHPSRGFVEQLPCPVASTLQICFVPSQHTSPVSPQQIYCEVSVTPVTVQHVAAPVDDFIQHFCVAVHLGGVPGHPPATGMSAQVLSALQYCFAGSQQTVPRSPQQT